MLTRLPVVPTVLAFAVGAAHGPTESPHARTPDDQRHGRARLVAEHTELIPGQTAHLGVLIEMQPGWHTYWKGRSDSGAPIEVKLDLPDGFTPGEPIWPAPTRHISPGDILDHIYEDRVTIIFPVEVPATARPGRRLTINGRVDYVICSSACVFEGDDVAIALPIAESTAKPTPSAEAALFKATRARAPRPLPTGPEAPVIRRSGNAVTIEAPGAAALAFFPGADGPGLLDPIRTAEQRGQRLRLRLDPDTDLAQPLTGVLEVRRAGKDGKDDIAWYTLNIPAEEKAHPTPPPSQP